MGENGENNKMDLSIIIVSFNTKKLLLTCVKSVLKFTKGINFEIVVVDNGSRDGSAASWRRIWEPK